MKPFKIRTPTPEVSEELQRMLFKRGFQWNLSGRQVLYTDRPGFRSDSNGRMQPFRSEAHFSNYQCSEIVP